MKYLSGVDAARIAFLCHEANRAYCASIGDHSQVAWNDAPEWQKQSAILGAKFVYANRNAPPSANHDSWSAVKTADGWVYGDVKDAEAKTHPCLVPFEELPAEQQFKDVLFRTIALTTITAFGL